MKKKGVDHSNCAVFRDAEKKALLLTVVIAPEKVAGKRTVLSAQVCGEDLKKPEKSHLGPKLTLYYKTSSGKESWQDVPVMCGTFPWTAVKREIFVPEGITRCHIMIGIQRTGGVFRVDDVKLAVLPAE